MSQDLISSITYTHLFPGHEKVSGERGVDMRMNGRDGEGESEVSEGEIDFCC